MKRATRSDRTRMVSLIADYHRSEVLRPNSRKIARVVDRLLRNKSSGILLVAREKDTVIGAAVATSLPSTEAGTMLIIQDLYVDPAFRRRGIGRALVAELLEEARALRVERVDLEVFSTNEAARRFWQHMGFRPTGRTVFSRPTRPHNKDEFK